MNGLHWIDWLLIGGYLAAMLVMGWWFGRKQKSAEDYFVAGRRLNPLLVGVSLFATLLSTISYLSMPGEALAKGPVNLAMVAALPVAYFVVAYLLLPVYMRQRVTSAYELLEERLGLGVRLLGAGMFLLLRLVWMSLLVYLAAKAMTVMFGISPRWIPAIVLGTGLISVGYTSLGGLRAVVVTDFLQTLLLFGGALLVVATVTFDFGGFDWFPTKWQANWDVQPIVSFDPKTRMTVVGTILSIAVWYVATVGGDQTSVQRFMATKDTAAARRALATQLIVTAVVVIALHIVGFALLGYYLAHDEELPASITLESSADDIFPRFIAYRLPIGVSGLVVASMIAAAMSSVDSGVNSISAVVQTDFVDRLRLRRGGGENGLWFARWLTFGIGWLVVVGSSLIGDIEGNITEVAAKTVNLLGVPLFALFVFALFIPFAHPLGVVIGAIVGTSVALLIAFSGSIVTLLATHCGVDPACFGVELQTVVDPFNGGVLRRADDPISFQWIGPVSLVVNLATGSMISLLIVWYRRYRTRLPETV